MGKGKESITVAGGMSVPRQHTGSDADAIAIAEFADPHSALLHYQKVKQRLADVNNWYCYSKVPLSSFQLFDKEGSEVRRPARAGDFIRIDLPGPGTGAGGGFDWVRIELLDESEAEAGKAFSLRARPAANPGSRSDETAHFLKDCSTSTFQVKLAGNRVSAEQHGRNEKTNTATGNTADSLRNTVVGWATRLGIAFPQWKSLVEGLVAKDKPVSN